MYACVCMYVYACPTPRCIITSVRYDVQKSILYVCPPPSLPPSLLLISGNLSLPFIWSSMDKHISDISSNYNND